MTTPPYSAGPPTSAGAAPRDVHIAFQLYIANVVLGLLASILTYSLIGAVIDAQLEAAGVQLSDLTAQGQAQIAAVRTGAIVGIVIGLALLALYVYFIFQMRKGKNWARIVLTVLTGISVVTGLFGFASVGMLFAAGPLGAISVILSIVQLILIIAAVVFMWRPAANAYFAGQPR